MKRKSASNLPKLTAEEKSILAEATTKFLDVSLEEVVYTKGRELARLRVEFTRSMAMGFRGQALTRAECELEDQLKHFKQYLESGIKVIEKNALDITRGEFLFDAVLASTASKVNVLHPKSEPSTI